MNLHRVTTRTGLVIGLLHCERAPLHSADAESIQTALLARRHANRLASIVGAAILVRFLRQPWPRPIATRPSAWARLRRAIAALWSLR